MSFKKEAEAARPLTSCGVHMSLFIRYINYTVFIWHLLTQSLTVNHFNPTCFGLQHFVWNSLKSTIFKLMQNIVSRPIVFVFVFHSSNLPAVHDKQLTMVCSILGASLKQSHCGRISVSHGSSAQNVQCTLWSDFLCSPAFDQTNMNKQYLIA